MLPPTILGFLVFVAASIWYNPIFAGLLVTIPSVTVAVIALIRTAAKDEEAARAAAIASAGAQVQRVIDSMSKMIDVLQTDNEDVREVAVGLRGELSSCSIELKRLATYEENRKESRNGRH